MKAKRDLFAYVGNMVLTFAIGFSYYPGCLVHEPGHLVAGWLTGVPVEWRAIDAVYNNNPELLWPFGIVAHVLIVLGIALLLSNNAIIRSKAWFLRGLVYGLVLDFIAVQPTDDMKYGGESGQMLYYGLIVVMVLIARVVGQVGASERANGGSDGEHTELGRGEGAGSEGRPAECIRPS